MLGRRNMITSNSEQEVQGPKTFTFCVANINYEHAEPWFKRRIWG